MKLSEFAVNRPITTIMIFAGILLLGVISLTRLPLELMPDVSTPAISVVTPYSGAAAVDVEKRVTEIVESAISTVSNVRELKSVSKEGLSVVTLTMNFGANIDEASNDVRDKLDWVKSFLPDEAGTPTIFKFNLADFPIFFLGVSATESRFDLYEIIEKRVVDPLKRIEGVGAVSIFGGLQRQINIHVERDRLAGYNVTIDQIDRALKAANFGEPAGNLKVGRLDFMVRVPGDFVSIDEIARVVVGQHMGKPIRVSDVATVEEGFKDETSRVRVMGRPGLMVMVQKRSGVNTVEVAGTVRSKLESLRKDLPPDVDIATIMDASEFIEDSLRDLTTTILWGALFVVLIVLFFLRHLGGSFIITLTIPFSIVLGFIFLHFRGYTINHISLSSLAIAIGMVVDNAVVILENIFRHTEEGHRPDRAAIEGSYEVGRAVIASTATTVAIFVPLIFIGGIVGILMNQLAYVVIIVLGASLFTALTLTPMLSSRIFRTGTHDRDSVGRYRRFYEKTEQGFGNFARKYRTLLEWSLDHKRLVVSLAALIFVTSMVPVLSGLVGTEFFPKMDQGEARGSLVLPVGTSVDETDSLVRKIEEMIQEYVPERTVSVVRMGQSEFGFASIMGREGPNIGEIMIELVDKDERDRSSDEIAASLEELAHGLPGAEEINFTTEDPMMQLFFGGGGAISVELYGHDMAESDSLAQVIKSGMEKIPGVVAVTVSREKGKPELRVKIDREKTAALGLSISQVASTIRKSFYGTVSTAYREAGEQYDIFIRLSDRDRESAVDLENVFIATPLGSRVSVANLARLEEAVGPVEIERKNRERVLRIESGVRGRPLGDVAEDLERLLSGVNLPEGYATSVSGSIEQQVTAFRNLLFALILGMILVYMVMAAQFESFVDPFVIIFSVPFGIVGVIWFLLLTGMTLNLMSFIGMVMLVGIVVNNSIVLVDYTNLLRRRGTELREAVLTSGQTRLRPVLMTALTTIFALVPLALSRGEGAEMWNSLAVAVIGGLLFSTVISLVLVPTLYTIFEERIKARANRKKG